MNKPRFAILMIILATLLLLLAGCYQSLPPVEEAKAVHEIFNQNEETFNEMAKLCVSLDIDRVY